MTVHRREGSFSGDECQPEISKRASPPVSRHGGLAADALLVSAQARLKALFEPALDEIAERSTVAGRFVHRDVYRLYIATLWANVVLDPEDAGIVEDDLEDLFEVLNTEIERVLGAGVDLTACFGFVNSKQGEAAMREARLTRNHKDLLLYFCSLILDPEGHRKWADGVRDELTHRQSRRPGFTSPSR